MKRSRKEGEKRPSRRGDGASAKPKHTENSEKRKANSERQTAKTENREAKGKRQKAKSEKTRPRLLEGTGGGEVMARTHY